MIPVILAPEHLAIDLVPSFLAMILIEPCGSVVGGFEMEDTENLMPKLVSADTKFITFIYIAVGLVTIVHWILDDTFSIA